MPQDPSFDIVSKPDLQEVDNAVNQAAKEIATRFDFKGSSASVTLDKAKKEVTLVGESENRLKAVMDILQSKLIKRGLSIKVLDPGEIQASGANQRQVCKIQDGIPMEKAKQIVAAVKESKLKVNISIQGDQLRVTGKSKDDLQAVIAKARGLDLGIELSFTNYR